MTNRTLQFCGYAYGDTPVQLNAHINGQVVFSGAVDTINSPIPPSETDISAAPPLFSVVDSALFPTEFQGSYPMTISVATGSGIMIQQINSNYMSHFVTSDTGNIDYPGNATAFLGCYKGGIPANSDGTLDPRSSVTIDDVTQSPPLPPSTGCWTWTVQQGSTIAYNLNVSTGNVAS